MLVIMDGFGCSDIQKDNAVAQADLKVLPALWKEYPHAHLGASGEDVGLPDGQIGNSEVGHLNIGAGRIVYQALTKITKDIREGAFFEKPALVEAMENVRKHDSSLHLLGLVSPGGVHSSEQHLFGLLEMAKRYGLRKVYVHAFLDGRDVLPRSAGEYLQELEDKCAELGVGEIATISGRYYAMDRDKRWDRVEKAYRAVALGQGHEEPDAQTCLKHSYAADVSDEFVVPTIIHKHPVADGDSMVFFNFRPDRARQLTTAFVCDDFDGFERRASVAIQPSVAVRVDSARDCRRAGGSASPRRPAGCGRSPEAVPQLGILHRTRDLVRDRGRAVRGWRNVLLSARNLARPLVPRPMPDHPRRDRAAAFSPDFRPDSGGRKLKSR